MMIYKPVVGDKVDFHYFVGGPVSAHSCTIVKLISYPCGNRGAFITGHKGWICLQSLTRTKGVK
jgi:hypothetical protein